MSDKPFLPSFRVVLSRDRESSRVYLDRVLSAREKASWFVWSTEEDDDERFYPRAQPIARLRDIARLSRKSNVAIFVTPEDCKDMVDSVAGITSLVRVLLLASSRDCEPQLERLGLVSEVGWGACPSCTHIVLFQNSEWQEALAERMMGPDFGHLIVKWK